jgi:hypothetical protein
MRAPCKECNSVVGRIKPTGAQDCVFCECGKFQYNAPRVETGRAVRTVATVHNGVTTKQRARILLRDGNACALCHAQDKPLHAGHLLSVDVGISMGLTEVELNDDANLAAMCDECNSGVSDTPLPLRVCVAILKASTRGLDLLIKKDPLLATDPKKGAAR